MEGFFVNVNFQRLELSPTWIGRKAELNLSALMMSIMPQSHWFPVRYCWFSQDVTKIQTSKLSVLPRFYFHDVLKQLKTNFDTNFRFKRVLGFVIESTLLLDAAFTLRPRELSHRLKKMTYFREFSYLNSSCIRESITLMFMSSSKNKFTLL